MTLTPPIFISDCLQCWKDPCYLTVSVEHREVSLDDAIHCFIHTNKCVSGAFYPDQDGISNGSMEIPFVTTSGMKGLCPLEPFGQGPGELLRHVRV
jgi:hypothetical protein